MRGTGEIAVGAAAHAPASAPTPMRRSRSMRPPRRRSDGLTRHRPAARQSATQASSARPCATALIQARMPMPASYRPAGSGPRHEGDPHRPRGRLLVAARQRACGRARALQPEHQLAHRLSARPPRRRGAGPPRGHRIQTPLQRGPCDDHPRIGLSAAFHLIEQPMLGICCSGPRPVSATCTIASYSSRMAPGIGVVLDASSRPRYCSSRSAL